MDIKNYFEILRRRLFIIIIVTATTLILVSVSGFFIVPVYEATATVRVFQETGISAISFADELQGDRLMRTYERIITSNPTLQAAAQRANRPPDDISDLYEFVTVNVIAKTELMRITFQHTNAEFTRDFPNALADLLIDHVQNRHIGTQKSTTEVIQEGLDNLNKNISEYRTRLTQLLAEGAANEEIETIRNQITSSENSYNSLLEQYELARLNEAIRANSVVIVERAPFPVVPINGLSLTDVVLALFLGIGGGIAVALVMENLDTRIHSPKQLQRLTQAKVIGVVPRGFIDFSKEKHTHNKKERARIEAYRLLSTHLQASSQKVSLRKIIITSPLEKEAKAMVSRNLSEIMSEQRRTVFLIECDLRNPVFNEKFGLNGHAGLSSYLVELVTLDQIIQPTDSPSLFVINSGPTPANPTALLDSPAMDELLRWVDLEAQMTLLDTPPILGLADVSILAPKVDGVILVVRQGHTTKEAVREALGHLEDCKAMLTGIVFMQQSVKAVS